MLKNTVQTYNVKKLQSKNFIFELVDDWIKCLGSYILEIMKTNAKSYNILALFL